MNDLIHIHLIAKETLFGDWKCVVSSAHLALEWFYIWMHGLVTFNHEVQDDICYKIISKSTTKRYNE
jgi:hypothetical protein